MDVQVRKPVHTIVIDDLSSTAYDKEYEYTDSFSFWSSNLNQYVKDYGGEIENYGNNHKPMINQVSPDGELLFIKTSTLGVENNEDGTSNLNAYGPQYESIGKLLNTMEGALATEVDGTPYVQVVFRSALKSDKNAFATVSMDEVNSAVESGNVQSLMDRVTPVQVDNMRVQFKINKDLSKKAEEDKKATLSTQLIKLALNESENPAKDVQELESSIVEYLQQTYDPVKQKLSTRNYLLEQSLKAADDLEKPLTSTIIERIQENNLNPDRNTISAVDHPNLNNILQSFIASRLTKAGIRAKVPGEGLHMIPDMDSDLQWSVDYDAEGNKYHYSDVKVPEGFANVGELLINVRIPASGYMSVFIGKVKETTPADTNTIIAPKEYIAVSDADFDADKLFVFRKEHDEGNAAAKIIDKLVERLSSPEAIEGMNTPLDVENVTRLVDKHDLNRGTNISTADLVDQSFVFEQMNEGAQHLPLLILLLILKQDSWLPDNVI